MTRVLFPLVGTRVHVWECKTFLHRRNKGDLVSEPEQKIIMSNHSN